MTPSIRAAEDSTNSSYYFRAASAVILFVYCRISSSSRSFSSLFDKFTPILSTVFSYDSYLRFIVLTRPSAIGSILDSSSNLCDRTLNSTIGVLCLLLVSLLVYAYCIFCRWVLMDCMLSPVSRVTGTGCTA